jgi:hypothetical protein
MAGSSHLGLRPPDARAFHDRQELCCCAGRPHAASAVGVVHPRFGLRARADLPIRIPVIFEDKGMIGRRPVLQSRPKSRWLRRRPRRRACGSGSWVRPTIEPARRNFSDAAGLGLGQSRLLFVMNSAIASDWRGPPAFLAFRQPDARARGGGPAPFCVRRRRAPGECHGLAKRQNRSPSEASSARQCSASRRWNSISGKP